MKNREKLQVPGKNTGAENFRWDLNCMYYDIDDPQIDLDIAALTEMVKSFHADHKDKLGETLGKAIADYADIIMLNNKIGVYLYLKQSTNVNDAAVKSKLADVEMKLSRVFGEYLTFFDIELVALSEEALSRLYTSDSVIAKHRPWIEYIRIFKSHILSESVESALTKREPFASGSWGEFYNELESDLRFKLRGENKTLTEMFNILGNSKSAKERAKLMKIINSGLGGMFAKYSAQALYMVVGSSAVEIKERSYEHPMDSRNKSNQIPDAVVDALHKAVENVAGPLAKRYYRLKAAHLNLKRLRWSDRNAPMPFSDTTIIPFREALKIVIEAYQSFSPTLAEFIRNFVENKHIDAPAMKGKRSGAYNYSIVLPGNIPVSFTLLDYLGSSRDVMILAHELGHGVHGVLAGQTQGPLMCHAPYAYCETASVFGEMTTYNFLKKRLAEKNNNEALLALIMGKIDDVINTMIRQIGLSNFERRLHGMDPPYREWKEVKKFSVEEIDALWLETLKRLYGKDGEIFTYENTEHLWSYIGHFHRPFYVYGYAFGQLLAQSIYAEQERIGDRFESLYLDLLRSGSTKNVVELLKPFGIDPTSERFWIDGITTGLGIMIEEAEELSQKMGISV